MFDGWAGLISISACYFRFHDFELVPVLRSFGAEYFICLAQSAAASIKTCAAVRPLPSGAAALLTDAAAQTREFDLGFLAGAWISKV